MPRVRMHSQAHPIAKVGDVIEVGEDEAIFLTAYGYASHTDDDVTIAAPAPEPQGEADTRDPDETAPGTDTAPGTNDEAPASKLSRPAKSATRAAWAAFAAQQGIDTQGMTKAQLQQALLDAETPL